MEQQHPFVENLKNHIIYNIVTKSLPNNAGFVAYWPPGQYGLKRKGKTIKDAIKNYADALKNLSDNDILTLDWKKDNH